MNKYIKVIFLLYLLFCAVVIMQSLQPKIDRDSDNDICRNLCLVCLTADRDTQGILQNRNKTQTRKQIEKFLADVDQVVTPGSLERDIALETLDAASVERLHKLMDSNEIDEDAHKCSITGDNPNQATREIQWLVVECMNHNDLKSVLNYLQRILIRMEVVRVGIPLDSNNARNDISIVWRLPTCFLHVDIYAGSSSTARCILAMHLEEHLLFQRCDSDFVGRGTDLPEVQTAWGLSTATK